ncbi:MAG: caspase family protein [Rhodocyclaceae bacterium]|nr:caspase family protein [Rhodocyclaceae bacterium]
MAFPLRLLLMFAACTCGFAHAAGDRNLWVAAATPASGEKRIALVIGNAAYGASPLKNPVNDARAMAAKLQKLGFAVVKRENLTVRQIGATLREFRSRLTPGAEALFFYAGHGLQVKGINYLPAVDADITSEEDVPNQSINVSQLLEIMDDAKTRLNLIFLDACRNNPFTRRFRSVGGGLAKIDAPSGTKISFATRPGSVAADGGGSNGLYTEYLLRVMDERGLPIEQALKRVYSGVKQASKGTQEPWEEGTIEGDFFFLPGTEIQTGSLMAPTAAARLDPDMIELENWKSAQQIDTEDGYRAYLSGYPAGHYATLAKAAMAKLTPLTQAAKFEPGTDPDPVVSFLGEAAGEGTATLGGKVPRENRRDLLQKGGIRFNLKKRIESDALALLRSRFPGVRSAGPGLNRSALPIGIKIENVVWDWPDAGGCIWHCTMSVDSTLVFTIASATGRHVERSVPLHATREWSANVDDEELLAELRDWIPDLIGKELQTRLQALLDDDEVKALATARR